MKREDFFYHLPNELIARYPTTNRSDSRLMVLNKNTGAIQHCIFREMINCLKPNDLLVFNDSRVIHARLLGEKETGGRVEVLVERVLPNQEALVHIRSSRSPKNESLLLLEKSIKVKVLGRQEDLFYLKFLSEKPVIELLETFGHIPLPPYIDRPDEEQDRERYQTVYSKIKGSVAAPTAGLHFDEALLEKIKEKGVECGYVTLHVGAGTFQPVKTDNIQEHKMHSEWITVSQKICDQVQKAKEKGGRVIAVGTTSVRCLETAATAKKVPGTFEGETDIFIYPGYQFQVVDGLLTNFHLPESTLLMLVCAFAGKNSVMNAYQTAILQKYRFFSYGDAMFIVG